MIVSAYYEDTLNAIGSKYQLTIEQINILQINTTIVLMGLISQEEFETELGKALGIDLLKISQIAGEVSSKIFHHEDQSNIVEKLDTRFDRLPKNIQEVIEKSNYQTKLYEISTAHKLSVTEMGVLDTITTDLIVGDIHPDEFKKEVMKKLGFSEEVSRSLVDEINEKVFKDIRGELMNLSGAHPIRTDDGSQGPSTSNGTMPLQSDLDTLKTHGIEISVPGTPPPQVEKLEIEAPHPLIMQKLSTLVQTPTVKTEYETTPKPTAPIAPKVSSYKPGTDPYRITPE